MGLVLDLSVVHARPGLHVAPLSARYCYLLRAIFILFACEGIMGRFSIFSATGALADIDGRDLESAILANLVNLAFLAGLADECGVVVSFVGFRAMPRTGLDDAYLRITIIGRGWRDLSNFKSVLLACYDGVSSWGSLAEKTLTRRCWYIDALRQAGLCDAQIGYGLASGLLVAPDWLSVDCVGDRLLLRDRALYDAGVSVLPSAACSIGVDGLFERLRDQSLVFFWEYHALHF